MNKLIERLLNARNRLLADTAVQRWLARSVFTRWIARRRARSLFNLTVGFVHSQTLFAVIKLDLLEQLRAGPVALESLAERCELPERNLEHLLEAAAALDLVSKRPRDRYALGEAGAALLGNPGIASMILHHERLYQDLANPLKVLQQGYGASLQAYWPYASDGNGATASDLSSQAVVDYSALMASSQRLIADDVLDAFSFNGFQRLLDVGGGGGAFVSAALKRWPNLQATVLDLPSVAELASQRFVEQGIADRASAVGLNMFKDQYPQNHDLVTLVRVLHDHDDEAVLHILKACRSSLTDRGSLVIAEPMAGPNADGKAVSAYFHMYLMAMGSGRPRTPHELERLLAAAGFENVCTIATARPLITRLLVAKRV